MEYKEWPFIEAGKLLRKIKKEGKERVVLESGYGPSGLPHIGTFGEVIRTVYVITALKILTPEVKTTFLVFSDDMDGLRSLPENVPNHEMLIEHLGKPLNSVPDPYSEYESFSANMNNRLKQFLNSFDFECQFVSSTDMYKSGSFNGGLSLIMKHYKKIIEIFTAMISEEKREAWSPFFPICQNCGKIYTTKVIEHDVNNNKIYYKCSNFSNPKIVPCNYEGETSIYNGTVKVGWKIDWALRWFALKIDYEMYGEDLTDSAVISDRVVRLIGGIPPITYKYELFLDEDGRKISKKLGKGVSLEQWLRYAPTDVLLYFMYSKPNQPKKMALSLIPKYVDEYIERLRSYKGEVDSPITIINYKAIQEKTLEIPSANIDYSLICNLVNTFNVQDPNIIMEYLLRYDPRVVDNQKHFETLVKKAILYNEEVLKYRKKVVEFDHTFDKYLHIFNNGLKALQKRGDVMPDAVQILSFEVAKNNNLMIKDWFRFLYQVLLSQESGPKIGSFICLYGIEPTIKKIELYLKGSEVQNEHRRF